MSIVRIGGRIAERSGALGRHIEVMGPGVSGAGSDVGIVIRYGRMHRAVRDVGISVVRPIGTGWRIIRLAESV